MRERVARALPGRRPSVRALSDRLARLEGAGRHPRARSPRIPGPSTAAPSGGPTRGTRQLRLADSDRARDCHADIFDRESPLRAVEWRAEEQVAATRGGARSIPRGVQTASRPGRANGEFRLDNQTYDRVDAELLYAIVRHLGPRRYVELGQRLLDAYWRGRRSRRTPATGGSATSASSIHTRLLTYSPGRSWRLGCHRSGCRSCPEQVVRGLGPRRTSSSSTLRTPSSSAATSTGSSSSSSRSSHPEWSCTSTTSSCRGDYSRGHVDDAHYWTEQYLLQAFLMYNRRVGGARVGAQAIASRTRTCSPGCPELPAWGGPGRVLAAPPRRGPVTAWLQPHGRPRLLRQRARDVVAQLPRPIGTGAGRRAAAPAAWGAPCATSERPELWAWSRPGGGRGARGLRRRRTRAPSRTCSPRVRHGARSTR